MEVSMEILFRNLRYGYRLLSKSKVFTLTAALTLALGIGANTAIFTVVYSTLLAPMPYSNPDQLVMLWSTLQGNRNGVSAADFEDWKRQNVSFQDLNAWTSGNFNLSAKDQPEYVKGQFATPGLYRMLGVRFLYGRDFLPEESTMGKEHVAILMNRLWKRLGADPNIVGKRIQIDGESYTVIGIMAPGIGDRLDPELVLPLVFKPDQLNHDFHWLMVMGRLKSDVSIKRAQANMSGVATNLAQMFPKSNKGWDISVEPYRNNFLPPDRIRTLWLLFGAVGFVLLIACANVANLLLARGITRQKEVALRIALGASRVGIFSQFLIEHLLLALVGGLIGIGIGVVSIHSLVAIMPRDTLPSEASVSLNLPILLFSLAASTIAGLLFGCAPAWFATHVAPSENLKEGGRSGAGGGRRRLRRLLVVAEFALALALLVGAGLTIHSFWNLTRVDLGMVTTNIQTFSVPVPDVRPKDSQQITAYYQQMIARIKALPGVTDASVSTGLPLEGPGFGLPFTIAGQAGFADPSQRPLAEFGMVTPEYFKTYGIQVTHGRSFTEGDNRSSMRVAMVNEEFVKKFLKDKEPLEQKLQVEQLIPGVTKLGPAVEWQIVGVFHNVPDLGFHDDYPQIEIPFWQTPWPTAMIGVHTAQDPTNLIKSIAAAVHSVDPEIALGNLRTMDEVKHELIAGDRFMMYLYCAFAGLGLLLASVGIYGVMAFTVAQREAEIGLRVALGARPGNVMRLILTEAFGLACLGLFFGLIGAYFVGHALQSTLYGVGSLDLVAISVVAFVLLAASLIASFLPARRAAAVQPMRALRTD